MDGGSKFVKGDAIAGSSSRSSTSSAASPSAWSSAACRRARRSSTYSLLTIGDGLVTQIPALLLSVVHRPRSSPAPPPRATWARDAAKQLAPARTALLHRRLRRHRARASCPGMPKLPFLLVGAALLIVAQRVSAARPRPRGRRGRRDAGRPPRRRRTPPRRSSSRCACDTLEILLAPDLVDLVDTGAGGDLLDRVRGLRRKIALELGIVVPPVRTRDSVDLPPSDLRRSGSAASRSARGEAPARPRARASATTWARCPAAPCTSRCSGCPASGCRPSCGTQAEMSGATVVDRVSVLITHLGAIVAEPRRPPARPRGRARAHRGRQAHVNPSVVEELARRCSRLGEVQRVLQGLLAEEVPIRDLGRIFEALSCAPRSAPTPRAWSRPPAPRSARRVAALCVQDGVLRALTLDPALEQRSSRRSGPASSGTICSSTRAGSSVLVRRRADARCRRPRPGPHRRAGLRAGDPARRSAGCVTLALPRLPVLSYAEITARR